ncbi:hypothetical protein HYX12_01835, partial [Candidatus Woesearchaeota archaeon]|nr:hypothetical protein [Candidatus Woesearchaeota archaeon]
ERSIEQREKFIHVGVKIFLRNVSGRKLLGHSLRQDLDHIYQQMVIVQIARREFTDAKGTEREENTGRVFDRALSKLNTLIEQLKTDVRDDDLIIYNLNNKVKEFYRDEDKLLEALQEVTSRLPRGRKLNEKIIEAKKGLTLILPLFEEISAKYHDFQGRLMKALADVWNALKGNPDARIDFNSVSREVEEAEVLLQGLIDSAEKRARDIDALLHDKYDNELFFKLIDYMVVHGSDISMKLQGLAQ